MRKAVLLYAGLSILCVVYRGVDAVPLASFYNYSSAAVTCLPTSLDDGHSDAIILTTPFMFFGVPQTTAYVRETKMMIFHAIIIVQMAVLQVNTNGVVSFGEPEDGFISEPFPIDGTALLTPFWGDVDTRGLESGTICYLLTSDPALLSRARDDVLAVSPTYTFFNPTQLLIATWDHVAHFDSTINPDGLVRES